MKNKQYILFTENPPLRNKGFGFSVLLYEIIAANTLLFNTIIAFNDNDEISDNELIETGVKTKIIDIKYIQNAFNSYKWRYIFTFFKFLTALPSLLKIFKQNNHFPILFCVGTSSKILIEAWIIGKLTTNPLHFYIVDDIIAINKHANNKLDSFIAQFFLKRLLQKSKQLLCISQGLREKLQKYIKNNAEVILPVFRLIDKTKINPSKLNRDAMKIVFTGGLSFLYNDTIKLFDTFLAGYNFENDTKHQLIIQTYSQKKKFDDLKLSENSIYRTSVDREQAVKILYEADIFLIPYSFSSQHQEIVSTSFPQKFAQIIQFQKPILVFAPSYSSLGSFCMENSMRFLVNTTENSDLSSVFNQILNESNQMNYNEIYESNFSPKVASSILLSSL